MIDIHSHIISGIDDGSKNTEMTIKMLEMAEESGTTDIVATPHFMRGRFEVTYKEVIDEVENLKKLTKENSIKKLSTLEGFKYIYSETTINSWNRDFINTIINLIMDIQSL